MKDWLEGYRRLCGVVEYSGKYFRDEKGCVSLWDFSEVC